MVQLDNIIKSSKESVPVTASDVLREKGNKVFHVDRHATVMEASQILTKHSAGSLLVLDDSGQLRGILSERDILRAMARDGGEVTKLKVSELMTKKVFIALETDSLQGILALMTEKRIRHVPVMRNRRVVGVLSIGDIVKAMAVHTDMVARQLSDYISGKYPS